MMKQAVIIEHIWCESDDRWVLIMYDKENVVIGLNYCQGNDYDYFLKEFKSSDKGLTEFYNLMLKDYRTERQFLSKLTFINKVCWTYHSATSLMEEYS